VEISDNRLGYAQATLKIARLSELPPFRSTERPPRWSFPKPKKGRALQPAQLKKERQMNKLRSDGSLAKRRIEHQFSHLHQQSEAITRL
jgi:hypothetical protein